MPQNQLLKIERTPGSDTICTMLEKNGCFFIILLRSSHKAAPKNTIESLIPNEIIPVHEHGFQTGRSTSTNPMECLNQWTYLVDKGKPIDVIYLDFSRAFNRVPRSRLLLKLGYLGCQYAFYADDTKLFCNALCDSKRLQSDIQRLETWCNDRLLLLNLAKCTILHIGHNNPNYVSNVQIPTVESRIDLGVTITDTLCWSEHVPKFSQSSDVKVLGIIFILPSLKYNVVVWSPHLIRNITLFEDVQRKLTKWAPQIQQLEYHDGLSALNLSTLHERRKRDDLIQYLRISTNPFSVDLRQLFFLNEDDEEDRLRGSPVLGSYSITDKIVGSNDKANSGNWQKVSHRRPWRRCIVGNNQDTEVKGVPKFVNLPVSRANEATSATDLHKRLKPSVPEEKKSIPDIPTLTVPSK
ncbi:hypothetical protein JTB14_028472 [Gonioctena quinquepunctata]|nr:hypothetical protein JTB14_028472 [Gonioctena quinquepunctata]